MKAFSRYREHSWLPISIVIISTFFSLGCSSSRSHSGATTNPLAAYEVSSGSSQSSSGTVIGDGNTVTPGSLVTPVISVTEDGSSFIDGHDNAPLLDNKHAGWQQSNCLTCHNDTTHNPDHNYSDDTLCYLCHGTNGLPGLSDSTPPVLTSVVVSPTENSVTISWKSDEPCVSRLIIKTEAGDKMEFPVSSTYTTSHKRSVSGLQSGTTYYYELICTDKSGNKTSTSSFSSVLMFKTNAAIVTPVTTSTETDTDTDTNLDTETADSLFSNVKFNVKDAGMVLLSFNTKTKPVKFYWRVYKDKETAKGKGNGQDYDDFNSNDSNSYSNVPMETRFSTGTYYGRIQAVMSEGDDKWSGIYKIKFD